MNSLEIARRLPVPRIIGSHLPLALLPDGLWRRRPKMIYVATPPWAIVSEWYAEYYLRHGYSGTLADFIQILCEDSVTYAPFHSHIIEFWTMRTEPNCWFVNGSADIFNGNLVEFTDKLATFLAIEPNQEELSRAVAAGIAAISSCQRPADDDMQLADKLWKRTNRTDVIQLSDQSLTADLVAQLETWSYNQIKDTEFRFETEIVQN